VFDKTYFNAKQNVKNYNQYVDTDKMLLLFDSI